MTRILHLSDHEMLGGAEVVFQNTVAASRNLGFDTEVAIAEPVRNPFSYVWSRRNANKLLAMLRDVQPDIVHLQNYYHLWSPSVLGAISKFRKSGKGIKVVMTAHDFHLVCPNSGMVTYGRNRMRVAETTDIRRLLVDRYDQRSHAHSFLKKVQYAHAYMLHDYRRQIDLILSPSHFLIRVFRVSGVTIPMQLVRNPIELGPVSERADGTRKGVVYFGRLTAEKGVLEAANELARGGIELEVYGDGDAMPDLMKLSERFGTVRVRGPLNHGEMLRELARFSVMIIPSRAMENAPLAVVEAASQGVKVVSVQGSGAAEMAELTASSSVYDPKVEGALSRAVLSALSDPRINRVLDPVQFARNTYEEKLGAIYRRLAS